MKIKVEAFAIAKERLGFSELLLDVGDECDVAGVIEVLKARHPDAELILSRSRVALNGEYADTGDPVHEGGVLSIIPPVSGGAPGVVISHEPIDVNEALAHVASPSSGAVVVFAGIVRETNEGKQVSSIEYECKQDMAVRELEKLIALAKTNYDISDAFIRHRIGSVLMGEVSVVIAVSAAHRRAAYAANAWILDELKKIAPIWKHEVRITESGVEKVWLGAGGG